MRRRWAGHGDGAGALVLTEPGAAGVLPEVRAASDGVERELDRATDRLRTLGPARLGAPLPSGATPAQAAREVAVRLEQLAAQVRAGLDGGPVVRRELPVLADRAVADQLAVVGQDLLAALRTAAAAGVAGESAGQLEVLAAARQVEAEVQALRRALP